MLLSGRLLLWFGMSGSCWKLHSRRRWWTSRWRRWGVLPGPLHTHERLVSPLVSFQWNEWLLCDYHGIGRHLSHLSFLSKLKLDWWFYICWSAFFVAFYFCLKHIDDWGSLSACVCLHPNKSNQPVSNLKTEIFILKQTLTMPMLDLPNVVFIEAVCQCSTHTSSWMTQCHDILRKALCNSH